MTQDSPQRPKPFITDVHSSEPHNTGVTRTPPHIYFLDHIEKSNNDDKESCGHCNLAGSV